MSNYLTTNFWFINKQAEPKTHMEKIRTAREIGGFLKARKKYWLGPVLIMLVLLGMLIVLGESTALGPFVYPFF